MGPGTELDSTWHLGPWLQAHVPSKPKPLLSMSSLSPTPRCASIYQQSPFTWNPLDTSNLLDPRRNSPFAGPVAIDNQTNSRPIKHAG